MQDLMDKFNQFFDGAAKVEIVRERLHVTVGTQTLFIDLPHIGGACSKPTE